MNITIQTNTLLEQLKKTAKFTASTSNVPIIQNIKLTCTHEYLILTATDDKQSIEALIPVDSTNVVVERTGSVVVPPLFVGIISKIGKSATISVNEKFQVTIKNTDDMKSEFYVTGLDADDFPRLPDVEGEPDFSLSGATLASLIERTSFAVAKSETRPILQGELLSVENGKFVMTATDSHRFARSVTPVNGGTTHNAVIPGKYLSEFAKVIKEEEKLDIFITDNQFVAKTATSTMYFKALDGTFPDTRQITPADKAIKLSFVANRQELIDALDTIMLITDSTNVGSMKVDKTQLVLRANSITTGNKGQRSIFLAAVEGNTDISISFNLKYLREALFNEVGKNVLISLTGPMSPFIVYPDNTKENIHLILPVRA